MLKIHRKTSIAVASGLAISLMAGCTAGGGDSDGKNSKEITYWASNQGASLEDDKTKLKPVLEKFEKETGVKVKLEVIPWDSLYDRILTAVSSGDAPDVLNIGNTWSVTLEETGAFEPIDADFEKKIGGKDRFIETSWAAAGKEDTSHTSVPLYGLAYNLYYNKKLFSEAGITEAPKTWDEFVATGKKLTKDTNGDGKIDQWGFTASAASVPGNSHQGFAKGLQHGSALFDKDGKPQFDDPAIIAGVTDYVNLMAKDKIMAPSDAEISDGSESVSQFIDGKAGMIFNQSPIKNFQARDFTDWGVAAMPILDPLPKNGKPIAGHVAGINISVFKNSDNKKAAKDFVAFMTDVEQQKTLNKAFTSLPVVTDAYDDPAFETEEVKLKQESLANNAAPMPLIAQEGQMETLIGTAIKELFAKAATGNLTDDDIKNALVDANSQMEAAVG